MKTLNTDICQEIFSLCSTAGPLLPVTSLAWPQSTCVWWSLTNKTITTDPWWQRSWTFHQVWHQMSPLLAKRALPWTVCAVTLTVLQWQRLQQNAHYSFSSSLCLWYKKPPCFHSVKGLTSVDPMLRACCLSRTLCGTRAFKLIMF